MCVCVWGGGGGGERGARVCVCVYACVRACVRVCVCVLRIIYIVYGNALKRVTVDVIPVIINNTESAKGLCMRPLGVVSILT